MNLILLAGLFVISYVITQFIHNFFLFKKKIDAVNHRSSHHTIATRTGGITIFIMLILTSVVYYFRGIEIWDYSIITPIGVMFIVGVYDDLYNADYRLKLVMQVIAAKILIDQGYVISNYHGLFNLFEVPWLLAQLTTIFVFVVVVNAFNFIDGIDGLAISQFLLCVIGYEILSENSSFYNLSLFLVFTVLPLYIFNFKKTQKVFLGDAGSLLLGTIVCIYLFSLLNTNFEIVSSTQINRSLLSVLLVLYPLIDLLRVFIIRIKNGHSPFFPDKNHIHHHLYRFYKNHIPVTISICVIQILLLYVFTTNFS